MVKWILHSSFFILHSTFFILHSTRHPLLSRPISAYSTHILRIFYASATGFIRRNP